MLQSWSRKANLPKTPPKTGPLGGFRFPSFLPILTEHAITSPRLSASISFQEFPTLGQVRRNRTQSISRPLESGCVVGESVDDFIRGHVEYDVTSTANTTQVGPKNIVVPTLPVLSRSKNQVVVDAGFFLHPVHPHKSDPRWGFVLQPFRFDTQLHEEAVQVDAHYDSLGNLDRKAFKVPLERTRLFLSRVGVRYENAKSHFELGYEGGWETNALDR